VVEVADGFKKGQVIAERIRRRHGELALAKKRDVRRVYAFWERLQLRRIHSDFLSVLSRDRRCLLRISTIDNFEVAAR